MRLRVLGCSGGELGRHRTTCFLLDGTVAIDAGALTSSLTLDELARVERVVLTHSHLDHVKDVPLLADLLLGRRARPLVVHASTACAKTLADSLFNDRLWPDFTRIPDRRRPFVKVVPFHPRRRFRAGGYTVDPVPVHHPVDSVGFVISDGRDAIAVSGDTGPTDAFWKLVNAADRVRAILVETSFPSRLQALADASGHLTPATLAGELEKLDRDGRPVFLYHLKPAFAAELRRELSALGLPGVRVLARGQQLEWTSGRRVPSRGVS
ncbi:MBL fold metallo-hydrolase [Anaeromyxobacter diazotrophicus]|uniref:cAMP phosphodiesterase class-II:metallo-beta-lactamase superfamily protein n=1 Tax=Anaeromyxobacter diazotrophicus TaxID=2590199 RepID=A0A7I9VNQ2_9BACT|nr:3',5'-cyclic-nucleotide phosphodiesterase [Anaeromyxobacter diazotrophicus]GEJ58031.1 cAMP phosphodiesterase class-II:metallo-beta-lactamase superfamily protein [Anaeromyxobacter diazotrophicus]